MAGLPYTSQSSPKGDRSFSGGLNSTAGDLGLRDNEASDLQNVDFDKFGSVIKRNGYTALNTSALTSTPDIDGLHWFEFDSSGTLTRKLVAMAGDKFFKMDDLDGTWDDATNGVTITAGNHADFENWRNLVFITNNEDPPLQWDGAGTSSLATMTVPTGLTDAKFNSQFNNFLFLGNVAVSGTRHASRIYWSNLNDETTWTATDFINISNNDGQEIEGLQVLSDRLVIFKTRSIYNLFFTGDSDIPFILPGGGKSNSSVGCVAGFSIQEVENGLVFLSYDGFYFYDGNNSFKISDKITTTFQGLNTGRINQANSLVQKEKNRYWCSLPGASQTENDTVLVWDYFNNAWTKYAGINSNAMTTVYVAGKEERPYFGDYAGFVYRADTGADDFTLNVQTAIDGFYQTNWKHYDDIVNQKGVPNIYVYFQNSNSVLTLSYTYDSEDADQFSQTFSLATSSDTYGSGVYGTATYAGAGGDVKRRDLVGRGRVVRFKFANSTLAETFRIDGLGTLPHLETNV